MDMAWITHMMLTWRGCHWKVSLPGDSFINWGILPCAGTLTPLPLILLCDCGTCSPLFGILLQHGIYGPNCSRDTLLGTAYWRAPLRKTCLPGFFFFVCIITVIRSTELMWCKQRAGWYSNVTFAFSKSHCFFSICVFPPFFSLWAVVCVVFSVFYMVTRFFKSSGRHRLYSPINIQAYLRLD